MTGISFDWQRSGTPVPGSTLVDLAGAADLIRQPADVPGELLWMGAGDWAASPLPGLVRRVLAGPGRGDRLRALVDGSCKVAEAAPWIEELEPGRVAVRIERRLPHDLLIAGQHTVLIPMGSFAGEPLLAVVKEPVSVRMIRGLFGTVWDGALSVEPGGDPGDLGVVAEDEFKQRILELLAEGAKDAVIARKLGVSLRTCRRHVAEILLELGAVSRFQAGAVAAGRGVIPARQAV
ncbi:response regulator transcription factor [Kitasatospora sp. NPDC088391]|uniref:helix-turn-helix transcriptional regulator n=1 Tax=Kitasatospora sp. NPDC088391 TaxID=3364074 RepID=UPI00380435B4